jgi:sec-independent protein translocase protein TatA
MDIPGWIEIAIVAFVVLVLFGTKKMPDAARSMGRSLRIFKSEIKGMHDDDKAEKDKPAITAESSDVTVTTPDGKTTHVG